MNLFVGSGKIARANLIEGGKRILKFTLAISENNSRDGKQRTDYVPCVIYNPLDEVLDMVSGGQQIELSGKVKTFSFEIAGEKTYKTEVMVNPKSLKILD